jgi:putative endopeptidase
MKTLKFKNRNVNHNKTKKIKIETQGRVQELCLRSGFNTFEGKLFKANQNNDKLDIILKGYRNYKDKLKKTISDAYKVKQHSNNDFYSYINDDWIQKQEEKLKKELKYYAQVDNFRIIQEKVYYEVIGYVNDYIKENPTSKKAKLIENVYKAFYKTNKSIGLKHTHKIKEDVERFIEKKDMYGLLAYTNNNEIYGWSSPLVWNVLPDEKNVSNYISHLSSPQLGVYDLYIYIDDPNDSPEKKKYKKEFKQKYLNFIRDTFKLVLPNNYEEFNPEDIWNVEIELLNALACPEKIKEDPDYYNKITKEELETKYGFNWTEFAHKLGYKKVPSKIVTMSLNSLKCITALLKERWDSTEWKTYWLFIFYKTIIRFEWDWNQTYYDFYANYVQGQPIRFPRELYPIFMLSFTFNTFLSEEYIKHNHNPLYVNYLTNMGNDLRHIYINRIKRNTWLSPSTKKYALKKLEKLKLIVGSPTNMREDPLLDYSPNDPWHNMNLLAEWRHNKIIEYDGGPVGIDVPEIDWNELKLVGTQPYIVNAFYNPTSNSIYVPLAYLQKPFIDLDERGIEYNLAFVGYTLGHELSHCLDDMGSKFDENGNLKNWWTARDRRIFNKKIKDVVNQYEEFAARDGIKFDAEIGIGENLADISGLSLAEEYLLLFQQANEDIDIIKTISLQAFYVYSAIQSRQKIHDKAIPAQLKTNPHPLEKYRCNCPLSRLELFRTIYNIKEGDGMWWRNTDTIW